MAKNYTGLRIDEEMLEKIDNIAKKSGRTRSNMIKFILSKFLETHEI